MPLLYTTTEAIERRLVGRLNIGGTQAPYGKTEASTDLLNQIGEQIEAKITSLLGQIYKLPLAAATVSNTDSRPIVAAIVEKGVVCELADVHFFQSEEGNSYGREMCRQFQSELTALQQGIPRLPGEALLDSPDLQNVGYAAAATRTAGTAEAITW